MATVSHRGGISFGMVFIPVALYKAQDEQRVSFNQLHKDDHSRVKQKKVCSKCGEEISRDEIVSGYKVSDDPEQYVVVTDEEKEALKTEKDRTIHIVQFTDLANIDPIFYEKTYHVLPESGGDKAFELLRTAMFNKNKVAIARSVISSKEQVLALRATDDGILISTLFLSNEIRPIPKNYQKGEVAEAELSMAEMLIGSLDKPFDITVFKDNQLERTQELILEKQAKQEIKQPEQHNVVHFDFRNLAEALAESLKNVQQNPGEEPLTVVPQSAQPQREYANV